MMSTRNRPLALPPAGSELHPVMGRNAGLPIVGETLTFLRDPDGYLQRAYAEDGPVAWRRALGQKIVGLLGPDAWGVVQQNSDKAFAHQAGYDLAMGRFFHGGVMLMDFDEHLFHRRIMQAAFGRDSLMHYLDSMNATIEHTLAGWPEQGELKANPAFKSLALNIATETFMGEPQGGGAAGRMNAAFNDVLLALGAIVRFPLPGARLHLPGTEWARGIAGREVLKHEIAQLIPEKRDGDSTDLLSVLCRATSDDGETFSDKEIVDHMIFMMFAAHDTSMTTMTTMAYHLAKHPEWQERCREESLALGPHASYEEIQGLTSLDLVMKEALRITPPVRQMFRGTVKDTEVLGHFIPAGTMVLVAPHFNHHMPEYWTNSEAFDPERFSEERREDKGHKYLYVPFGSHAHKCIGMYFAGMEIKATMHQLLRSYEWSVAADYELGWAATVLPTTKDGLPIAVRRRHDTGSRGETHGRTDR